MEFTIPKTPPQRVQKVKPFPVMDSSNSMETEDLNEGQEDEEEMNSFDEEKENETDASVRLDHQTSIDFKSLTPQVSARASDSVDIKDDNSPTLKEKINKLYGYIPEIASHFSIIKRIGEGTFSSVYLARLKHHPEIDQMFALKHIIPTSHPQRIENELKCLLKMGGCDNVMGVKMCVRNRDHVVIVMPYFPHVKFQDCLFLMSLQEAKEYMKNLLISLQRIHHFDVIHRDIKPANFLYSRQTKQYALVDFGLASGPFLVDPSKMTTRKSFSQHATQPTTATSSTRMATSHKASTTCLSTPHHVSTTSSASALIKSKTVGNASVSATSNPVRSPSRKPLSPLKRGDGSAARRNLMGRVTKLNERKETPSPSTRLFAPSFSTASASLLRQSCGMCDCYGKPVICELCIARTNQIAPRAGTAGFRAPEVLLKSPNQTTAVDMWSAGVIFLSLLSARYPFFKATDDLGYMAQIISLLGTQPCIKAALSFGKLLTLSESIEPCDLQVMCEKLRHTQITAGAASTTTTGTQQAQQPPSSTSSSPSTSACPTTTKTTTTTTTSSPSSDDNDDITATILDSWSGITSDAYHLLARLLDPNPKTRISAKEALRHPFFDSTENEDQAERRDDVQEIDTQTVPHPSCVQATTVTSTVLTASKSRGKSVSCQSRSAPGTQSASTRMTSLMTPVTVTSTHTKG